MTHPSIERTQAFYEWEKRARGWHLWPYPVALEPPFVPFNYYDTVAEPVTDDARRETLLSALTNSATGLFKSQEAQTPQQDPLPDHDYDDSPQCFAFPDEHYCTLQIALPKDFSGNLQVHKNLLQSLRYGHNHISFEVVGTNRQTTLQLGAWENDIAALKDQLLAQIPEATQNAGANLLPDGVTPDNALVVDFALEHEAMLPLLRTKDLKHDPLTALIGSMEALEDGETCIFQLLFTHTHHPWESHFAAAVVDADGTPFFADAPEMVPLTKEKISSPLYAVIIRIAVVAEDYDRRLQLARTIGGTLAQFDDPRSNNLMPLDNDGYDAHDHWNDVIHRTTHRSGMLLSLDELVGLMHMPDAVVRSEKLVRERKKTKAAPSLAIGHSLVLGQNTHRGVTQEVSLNSEQRTKHMYVVGASGTGKSTLLLNGIRQDIENGEGLCVIDPHGDLIDGALSYIPEHRYQDVILLDPSDEQFPIGLNVLDAHSNLEKTLLSSDLAAIFERLSTTWGDQMNAVLSNGILAFLESTEGGTLIDLRRFLVEKDFRDRFLETVTDKEIVYYWQKEFPLLSGRPQASVLTRLDTFLRPKPIRHMVAQKKSAIDFSRVMDDGKILLAKLSHGGIGEENSFLLGALLASKFHQAALARQAVSQEKRRYFWLYIDEFQNFLTPSIEQTLSGVRKYHVGMILAHQELAQLSLKDRAVAASVIANPYTRICFRMGERDARVLSEGFSAFDSQDLQSLGTGEAIGRIEQAAHDFSLTTYRLPPVDPQVAHMRREAVRQASRAQFASQLSDVERRTAGEEVSEIFDGNPQTTVESTTSKKPARKTELRGKGGDRHVELQNKIQKMAHERGLGAEIEKHIGDGLSIDVVLSTPTQKVACEISATTSAQHECKNIEKCLEAGYQDVLVLAEDEKHLAAIQRRASESLSEEQLQTVQFHSLDSFHSYIDSLAEENKGKTIRGYTVETEWVEISEEEKKRRELIFAKIVSE